MEEEYFEQHWLFNSNPIKIGQRYRTDKEISMLKNKSLEKINSVIFKLRQHNSEYMQDLADELEEAIKDDMVNVKYRTTLQEIKELSIGLINGSIGGCEDDIGYMLQEILTKVKSEE